VYGADAAAGLVTTRGQSSAASHPAARHTLGPVENQPQPEDDPQGETAVVPAIASSELPGELVDGIRRTCEGVLAGSWREGTRRDGVPFGYTCPSPGHYPWQWYWDSCFAAMAWRRFDPPRARRELTSLVAAARPDGFIGHTIFWNKPLSGARRFTYNVTSPHAPMTSTIQPPALAWGWRIAVGDPRSEPGIMRQHEWLAAHRDLDGDGLIWLLQPDESGLDASPQFDRVWKREAHGLPGYVRLVRRNRHFEFDLRRVAAAGGPVVCEVMTNVLYSLSRSALGLPSLTATLVERCYDERRGVFWPVVRPDPGGAQVLTWAALSPLALPDLPQEIGHRLVQEHLLDERQFWLPVPPPSVAAEDPSYSTQDRGFLALRRYWRGPTWINAAWLLWLGLVRLGYAEQASELARRVADAVARQGLREYYHPRTGQGMGARDFAWSALVVELTEPDPRAATSYLEP
jgi:Glycosyl hydrolase family 63 C-terminal domain